MTTAELGFYLAAAVVFAFVALCAGCAITDHLSPTPTVDDLLTGPPSDTPIFDSLAAERLRAELDAWGAQ